MHIGGGEYFDGDPNLSPLPQTGAPTVPPELMFMPPMGPNGQLGGSSVYGYYGQTSGSGGGSYGGPELEGFSLDMLQSPNLVQPMLGQQQFQHQPQYQNQLQLQHQHQHQHLQQGQQFVDPNNTTVFVGGLSSDVSEPTLHTLFKPFGLIQQVKIPPGKNCGFVKYSNREEAEEAIAAMQGFVIGGNRVRLSWGRVSVSNKKYQQQQQQQVAQVAQLQVQAALSMGMDPASAIAAAAAAAAAAATASGGGGGSGGYPPNIPLQHRQVAPPPPPPSSSSVVHPAPPPPPSTSMSAMNLPPPIHGMNMNMNMNMNIPILPHIPQYQNIPYQSHFVSDDGRESSGGSGGGHNGDLNQGITSSSFLSNNGGRNNGDNDQVEQDDLTQAMDKMNLNSEQDDGNDDGAEYGYMMNPGFGSYGVSSTQQQQQQQQRQQQQRQQLYQQLIHDDYDQEEDKTTTKDEQGSGSDDSTGKKTKDDDDEVKDNENENVKLTHDSE